MHWPLRCRPGGKTSVKKWTQKTCYWTSFTRLGGKRPSLLGWLLPCNFGWGCLRGVPLAPSVPKTALTVLPLSRWLNLCRTKHSDHTRISHNRHPTWPDDGVFSGVFLPHLYGSAFERQRQSWFVCLPKFAHCSALFSTGLDRNFAVFILFPLCRLRDCVCVSA